MIYGTGCAGAGGAESSGGAFGVEWAGVSSGGGGVQVVGGDCCSGLLEALCTRRAKVQDSVAVGRVLAKLRLQTPDVGLGQVHPT